VTKSAQNHFGENGPLALFPTMILSSFLKDHPQGKPNATSFQSVVEEICFEMCFLKLKIGS
jgi:hypothetical protein